MQDRLESEKAVAAERAKKADASSRGLQEQQAQTAHALSSVQEQMSKVASRSASDPRFEAELASLRKQVCGWCLE